MDSKKKGNVIKIIIAIILVIAVIIVGIIFITNKSKETKAEEKAEQIEEIEETEDGFLKLTSEMIEDITKEIETNEIETNTKVIIGLYQIDGMGSDINDVKVEVTNHKQTDRYTYTAYVIISWTDNYGKEHSSEESIAYKAANKANEKDLYPKGYIIDREYSFL